MARDATRPNIAKYPAAEALAAMILGRGNMPVFAGNTFDVRQQAAVALYVDVGRRPRRAAGAWATSGRSPRDAVFAGGCLLVVFAVWLAWKARKAGRERKAAAGLAAPPAPRRPRPPRARLAADVARGRSAWS